MAFLQVIAGGLLFATLTGTYLWDARRTHQVELRLVDAMPLVKRADVTSLKQARAHYQAALAITADERAELGLCQTNALLWVLHGMGEFEVDAVACTRELGDGHGPERVAAKSLVAIAQKRYAEAVALGTEELDRRAGAAAVNWTLGIAQRQKGDLRKGREHLREAQALEGSAPHFGVSLGDAFEADLEPRNAHVFWSIAATANPKYVPAQARNLMVKARSNSPVAVLDADLERLTAMSPQDIGKEGQAAVAMARAEVLYYRGQFAVSLKAAQMALDLGGDPAMAWHAVGRAQLALGHRDEGLAAFDKALTTSGGADKYVLTHARALSEAGRYDAALGVLEGSPQRAVLMEMARYHVMVGELHLAKGDAGAAVVAFDRALQREERSPEALLGRAKVALHKKRFDEATQWLEKTVSARSDFPDAYETVGLMWIEQGAGNEGNLQLQVAEKLMLAQGVDPVRLRQFYERVVEACTKHKESKLASTWSQRAKAR